NRTHHEPQGPSAVLKTARPTRTPAPPHVGPDAPDGAGSRQAYWTSIPAPSEASATRAPRWTGSPRCTVRRLSSTVRFFSSVSCAKGIPPGGYLPNTILPHAGRAPPATPDPRFEFFENGSTKKPVYIRLHGPQR